MKRLIVPLDGSSFAETALPMASDLARRFGAELHVASVVSDLPPVPLAASDGAIVSEWFRDEEERASRYLADRREGIRKDGVDTVETHVRSGPVTRTVQDVAAEVDADLFVLTTHGRGAFQRAWLGSVADGLIRRSQRPALLLRGGDDEVRWEGGVPGRVVVPLDGSGPAETAVEAVRPLLDADRSVVELVMVIHQPFPLATTYLPHAATENQLLEARKTQAADYLEGVAERLRSEGITVEATVHVAQDAGSGVLQRMKDGGADLVAVATRGRGGATRFVLGSVADKIIRGARIPVLVARRPPEED